MSSDNALVVANSLGRTLGELPAKIENDNPLRKIHHDAHIVLDQHHRDALLFVNVEDETRHVFFRVSSRPVPARSTNPIAPD